MWTLYRLFGRWPLPLLHAVGALLGWLTWLASPTYRRRIAANAALAGYAPQSVSQAIAREFRTCGPVITIGNACSASSFASGGLSEKSSTLRTRASRSSTGNGRWSRHRWPASTPDW